MEKLWPDWKDIVTCHILDVVSLNDQPLTIVEKQQAVERKGNPQQQRRFAFMKWDWLISFLCDKMEISAWTPEKFKHLNLKQAKLREFHVGCFLYLKKLDISNNEIMTLWRCGLERCSRLQEFDFSNNLIKDVSCLKVLHFLENLQKVNARGNPFSQKDYELNIIYYTSSLKGSNRTPGLIELNGREITIQQRAEAAQKFGNKRVEQLKWYYSLIRQYGHYQLRYIPNFAKRVKILDISRASYLTIADLSAFENLEYIDLSNNDLEDIMGLSNQKNLKYFDVRQNPRLEKTKIVETLSKHTNLRIVNLVSDAERTSSPKHGAESTTIRTRIEILLQLLQKNSRLLALDNQEISVEERFDVNPHSRMSALEIAKYKFYIAIVSEVVPFYDRIFSDKMVKPGSGLYDPYRITTLTLTNLRLKEEALDFELFIHLTHLNLSNNSVKSITGVKLTQCTTLEVLDLSFNKIRDQHKDIADYLNNLPSLKKVYLVGNPFLTTYKDSSIWKHLNKDRKFPLKVFTTETLPFV